jgi:dTDP-glucose 4,6-dehydratase
MRLLVTGGSGFIGSNFIHQSIAKYGQVINLDNLSYGSNPSNLDDIKGSRKYRFVKGSTWNSKLVLDLTKNIDVVVNFAAESHVDRSISDPAPFVRSNIVGTFSLLEAARRRDVGIFLQISTDEVYGDAETRGVESFTEEDSTLPSNPYAATKASAESLALSYCRTYGLNCIVTRCSNNFGPYQSPEKLVPKTIIRALSNQKIPLYGGGLQKRSWIYVLDHVDALNVVIDKGRPGQIYNISAYGGLANREIVATVLSALGKSADLIEAVEDRPGHDKRYSVDSSRIRSELGWNPHYDVGKAVKETVNWYVANRSWWSRRATRRMLHPTPWKLKWSK